MIKHEVKYKTFKLEPIITDGKPGELVDIDINKICLENNFIFNVSKYFYINNLNSHLPRGNQSNYNVSEILICLTGSFEIKLHDGTNTEIFKLNKNDAIYINKNIWIEFYNFNECIIIAFINILNNDKRSCYNFDEFILNK